MKLKNINNNISSFNVIYLVSKIWIDKWKKYSNYEEIKNDYLQRNLEQHEIMNNLIYYKEKHNFNYQELKPIKIIYFNNIADLESFVQKDSLVLINYSFCRSFNSFLSYNYTLYNANNNTIQIKLEEEILTFPSNNNIISLYENKDNNYALIYEKYNIYLKQLIKIFYFQKEFKTNINSNYHTKSIKNIYLINKKLIKKFKDFFEYNILYEVLENNQFIKPINNYLNKGNFSLIISLLNNVKKDYIDTIRRKNILEELKFNEDDYKYNLKILNTSNELIYFDDFEILNENIISFFLENSIIKKENAIYCQYFVDKGKILLIFKINNNNLYEIGFFDDLTGDFIIEYLIKEINHNSEQLIPNKFSLYRINFIIDYYFKKSNNNIIQIDEEQIGYFYNIKEDKEFNKSQNNINILDNNENIKNIKDIFSILLSIFFYEKQLNQLKNNSLIQYNSSNNKIYSKIVPEKSCYLIKGNFLAKFRKLFLYEKLKYFIEKYQINKSSNIKEDILKLIQNEDHDYFNSILVGIKEIPKIFENNCFNIDESIFYINNNEHFYYPINFEILSIDIYHKLWNIISTKNEIIKNEFNYYFFQGKIIFIPYLNNHFHSINLPLFLAYIFSMNQENSGNINYIPESIISFNNNYDRNNFTKLIKKENIINFCKNNFVVFNIEYKCTTYLI